MTQDNQHNEMPKDTVEEILKELVFSIMEMKVHGDAELEEDLQNVLTEALTTAYNKGVEVERERTAEIMDKVICRRWAGIENCPLDPLGQCEKCRGRALYHRQLEKALTP